MMKEADVKFLRESFKKYYFDHFDLIKVPERTMEREFGYQKFDSAMIRHIAVKDDKELRLLFVQNVPSDVYCSNAYYSFPNLPMNEKDWKEADLIFDIDAKDLNLPCRNNHTVSTCNECDGISKDSQHCLKCNSTKLKKMSLPCKNCMEASKMEVSKLREILTEDLGIDKDSIHVYFSGNEGFHVHVFNSQFQDIGARERSGLVDYIMFRGAIPERFGMKKPKPDRSSFPELDEGGWRGRFARQIFGSKSRRSKTITELIAKGNASFQKTLDDARQEIGVKIDPNVTSDIHRIFRLPGSINSKSGLAKIRCGDLARFDPYVEASFLSDEPVKVIANCPIGFSLQNKKFGPYTDEKVTIPTFAAVYMVCKKLATLA